MPDYLHSLIPLADFKALLSIDDREDALSRICLTMATYTIEQYCHRRLLKKRRSEYLAFAGDYEFPLGNTRYGKFWQCTLPTLPKKAKLWNRIFTTLSRFVKI
jgi:hypothetical protein